MSSNSSKSRAKERINTHISEGVAKRASKQKKKKYSTDTQKSVFTIFGSLQFRVCYIVYAFGWQLVSVCVYPQKIVSFDGYL